MKKLHRARDFLAGVLTTALVLSLVVPAGAALVGKTIQVYTGVDLYVDDVKLSPKDANGNPVEAFVYNGTTYLPVRAVGDAVGKTVQWEPKTQSVYLGKHDSTEPSAYLDELTYFYKEGEYWSLKTGYSEKDNLGTEHIHSIWNHNPFSDLEIIWKINGQYSKMTGTLYQPYDGRNDHHAYTVQIYGDEALLFSGDMGGGKEPTDFNIDLTGVLELKVLFVGTGSAGINQYNAHLGDVALYT